MGDYTELHFNAKLRRDTPSSVISVLRYMVDMDGIIHEMPALPEHELFKTQRWWVMLRCDSYYFDASTHSTLHYDPLPERYYLSVRTNLKNYDDEIEKFVNWIMPYLDKGPGQFLGFSRDSHTEQPTLIHVPEGCRMSVGYWTQHRGNTGDTEHAYQATCETCGWTGEVNDVGEVGWQRTADELDRHRSESRAWVDVAVEEEAGVVYVCEDDNYEFSGLRDVYASLYDVLVDEPHQWLLMDVGYWRREDGDSLEQTAMTISKVEVRRRRPPTEEAR